MGASASPARGETDPIESEEGPGRNEDPEARVPESGWDLGRGARTGCIGGIPGTAVRAGAGTAACGGGGGGAASGCEGSGGGGGGSSEGWRTSGAFATIHSRRSTFRPGRGRPE